MAIRLVVYMEEIDGSRDAVRATYAALAKEVRSEPGCIEFEMYQSIERPGQFALLERWQDQESLQAHGQRLRERDLGLDKLRNAYRTDRIEEA